MTIDPHPAGMNEYVLPEEFCATCAASKLTVYGEFKCEYSGAADIGVQRTLLEIGGNAGTASGTRNRLMLYVTSTGRIIVKMRDDADADHHVTSVADVVDYSDWFSVRTVLDFADLSRIDMWVNDSNTGMTYTGNAGTCTFDTGDCLIRLAQDNAGTVNGFCKIRNLRIYNSEVRP